MVMKMSNTNTVEKISSIKTTATFSKDSKHRYLLKMEWDDKKPKAAIIMTYPSTADEYFIDQTTMLVRNNAVANNFGAVSILNIFSAMENGLPKSDKFNTAIILKECSEADVILLAYGRSANYGEKKEEMLQLLSKYAEKLYTIADHQGRFFSHPLSPSTKKWNIIKLPDEYLPS